MAGRNKTHSAKVFPIRSHKTHLVTGWEVQALKLLVIIVIAKEKHVFVEFQITPSIKSVHE